MLVLTFAVAPTRGANRIGPEFRANTHTEGGQRTAALVLGDEGDFVVVWASNAQDGGLFGVFAQRYDSAGNAVGVEFQVNTYTQYDQRHPAAAIDATGDFVVAWSSAEQDGSGSGVFARRFASNGVPQATEFRVNAQTSNEQTRPAVAMEATGEFVVAWQSFNQDGVGGGHGVFARRFDSTGSSLATEFAVNLRTLGYQDYPSVAIDADGDFLVAWESGNQDGALRGIFARRFDSNGAPQASEFQVNTYTFDEQALPAASMESNGDFVVVWQSYAQSNLDYAIFGRRFTSSGIPLAAEFQVSAFTSDRQRYPAVGIAGDGRFVVAWASETPTQEILARSFDSTGAPVGLEFLVNTHTSDQQTYPAVGVRAGDFVIVWNGYSQDGDNGGVFGQRFADLAALDVDGNGSTVALTDGLLVLRRLFGVSGAPLINGAVGGACTRCDAGPIAAYIDGLGSTLDVDFDLEVEPLTDGLLVLRFLFDFTGAALTSGAVDTFECERCGAAEIEAYLDAMK